MILFCATTNSQSLYQRANAFVKFMRWSRFKDASLFVNEKEREAFLNHYRSLEVVFTDVEVEDVKVNKEKNEGVIEIRAVYYRAPTMVIKEKKMFLKWRWENKEWFLEEGWELK